MLLVQTVHNHVLCLIINAGFSDDRDHCRCREMFTGSILLCSRLLMIFFHAVLNDNYAHIVIYKNINFEQAFVGVAPDPRSIIIAFRGTQEHRYKELLVTYI